MIKLQKDF